MYGCEIPADEPHVLAGHQPCKGVNGVTALLCTQDGGQLVSGGRDGRILMWDCATRTVAVELSAAGQRHGDSDGAPLTNAQVFPIAMMMRMMKIISRMRMM